ncbi:MAG: LysR family transcriptional regulator [Chloroflexi bacterium]|nr:LysR family transcriptional regulator [Chloroflexota bacterium]
MNIKQLLYFHTVASYGNYSRAAEELGISEPVIHRAVRKLEGQYGLKLLERRGRRISLTEAGSSLFNHAAQIASLAQLAERVLLERTRTISGKITIGTDSHAIFYVLPDVILKWMADHPSVKIVLRQERAADLEKLLMEGEIDVVFGSAKRWPPELRSQPIFLDRLVVVSAPTHPAVGRAVLPISQLSQQRLILRGEGCEIRAVLGEVEQEYGVRLNAAVELSWDFPIKQLCVAGVGAAVMPLSSVQNDVANGRLCILNVEGFPRDYPYYVVFGRDKALTEESQSLLSAILQSANVGAG